MPLRTCLGCRKVREKSALIRFASIGGSLKPDIKGALKGRGAYICPDKRCVEEAYFRKDLFSKALRTKVAVPDKDEFLKAVTGLAAQYSAQPGE